jgi:hypothetical protein
LAVSILLIKRDLISAVNQACEVIVKSNLTVEDIGMLREAHSSQREPSIYAFNSIVNLARGVFLLLTVKCNDQFGRTSSTFNFEIRINNVRTWRFPPRHIFVFAEFGFFTRRRKRCERLFSISWIVLTK